MRVIRVFLSHLTVYPWTTAGLYVCIVLLVVLQVLAPVYYKELVDVLVKASAPTSEVVRALFAVLLALAAVRLGTWMCRRGRGFFLVRLEPRLMRDLAMTAFNGLLGHSHRFFADNFSGSLVRRVNKFVNAIEVILDKLNFNLIPVLLLISGSLTVLFLRDALLGFVLLAGIIVLLGFNIGAALWKQKYEIQRSRKDSEATGVLADALGNISTIKLFGGYRFESALFRRVSDELRRIRTFTSGLHEIIGGVQGAILVATEIAMLAAGIVLWQRGILTVGDFVLIQAYLANIFERIADFEQVLRRMLESFADASEMVETLDMPPEVVDAPHAKQLSVGKSGSISFDKVTFAFQKAHPVLNDFSLSIAPGEKVALVGSSGAGKTTITRLLLRFYDIRAGAISINGQDISKVTLESLWNSVALVPQEPMLFHRTLKENILYGRRDATDAQVIEAARRAHCHEFIDNLPKGYDTFVGERGVKLSGGERQRIAIARAILKNAPVLILDEATSSLDSESEMLIQDALHELMREKTVIAIAHRLSTIKEMDRIVVIEDGAIVAEGSHDLLLSQNGIYRKLWDIQAGKFM